MEYRYSQQNSPNNEHPLNQGLQGQELLNDIYMDMFLKHIHAEQQISLLLQAIDEALDARDETEFMKHTYDLLKLQSSLEEID
ncbi:IDEAL domain-containing protein [Kurthia sibirica]|uniref:IDEAL domain-containing protein n=1 Tax=Kurthia sibirica TaxID=202750 RepID=A0A2U3AMQ6_9BACL|nr:IDEAL domain-containing protein [Kurthia sibirica]PWI25818.1 hypothetical protein DEX24_06340 [Kurthia sibirica]GEK33636.1 hypothetical protein KSI01_11690 [Kurthia sibirica]